MADLVVIGYYSKNGRKEVSSSEALAKIMRNLIILSRFNLKPKIFILFLLFLLYYILYNQV